MEKSIFAVVAGTARVVRLAPDDHVDVVNLVGDELTVDFPLLQSQRAEVAAILCAHQQRWNDADRAIGTLLHVSKRL
ncbi:hypothetical protein [Ancylobacter defluvii]|uniref:Uncharacterized protein n=1 Tax=Ancylobacter defluvii TaxID=1282440 RepID=A0A9W6N9L1_9HYPH|nr:hypothetical protein [Ancylobacter defluvii]MBS7590065.1 hypothetical protein [Ancylobacter defluvii]GLK82675.1 hypothetical protein GCM10017653_07440 [Ancylobacter defluvii]